TTKWRTGVSCENALCTVERKRNDTSDRRAFRVPAGDCDIETIREKVAATDERLRRTDHSGPRGGYSFSKQTCEELEILFNAIESRLSRCTESEKNRYGLILDSGRRMAELKCRDVMDSAASKEYISCLRNYNHTADQCMERLSALKDEYKEYSAGLTNSNDVCW
ncbi:unnamed protein product, partial [Ixodes pacificus]